MSPREGSGALSILLAVEACILRGDRDLALEGVGILIDAVEARLLSMSDELIPTD